MAFAEPAARFVAPAGGGAALRLDVRTIAGSHGRVATFEELVAAAGDPGTAP